MSENMVLRKISQEKRDEITGGWRKLCIKELYSLYSSPNRIRTIMPRRMRWTVHVADMWVRQNAYRVLV
jgi:hypothetical protein